MPLNRFSDRIYWTHELFSKKMKDMYPTLKLIGTFKKLSQKILVEDSLGLQYMASPSVMLKGNPPSIRSAVDKKAHFIKTANITHGNKYDYSKVEYVNDKTHVQIICNTHGTFSQTPDNHKRGGDGCPKCVGRNRTPEEFFSQCNDTHNGLYTYDRAIFTGIHNPITVTCKVHGDFQVSANSHLNSESGCTKCHGSTYDTLVKVLPHRVDVKLYLFKCYNDYETFYKVGLSKNIPRRIDAIPYKVEVIIGTSGFLINNYRMEQFIILMMKKASLAYTPKIKFGGHTECFKCDDWIINKMVSLCNEPVPLLFYREEIEAVKRKMGAESTPVFSSPKEGEPLPF